ncbi:MAG TPA: hypothetical protein VKM55_19195 [Candidatus Lokiarchaeia archaeon]|nr:hypothetical protein [Candidatus Lokiarchaeia archaeon]
MDITDLAEFGHDKGKRKIVTGVLLILIGIASLMVITFGYLSITFSMQYYSATSEELFIILANGIGVFFISMGVGLIQRRYQTSDEEHKAIRKNMFLIIVLLLLIGLLFRFISSLF